MARWLKQAGKGVLAVAALAMTLWATSRLQGPTDAQDAALATMRNMQPLEGRNAFGALWLMPYAVPPDQQDAILSKDFDRQGLAHAAGSSEAELTEHLQASSAGARFPDQSPSVEDFGLFCGGMDACLQKVAAAPDTYRSLLERHRALLDRAETLQEYRSIRQPLQGAETRFPPYQYGKLPATRYALQFVEGHPLEAFDGVCRGTATWRRLGANSDTLIARMIGVAYSADVYVRLFAEMLAQTPRNFRLPASCAEAFMAPAGKEIEFCQTMRGEFAFFTSTVRMTDVGMMSEVSKLERWLLPLLFDEEMAEADYAESLAYYCSDEAAQAMAEDRPLVSPKVDRGWLRFQCIGNSMGCRLAAMSESGLDTYADRVEDSNASFRLIALILALRAGDTDAHAFAGKIESAAAEVGNPLREIGVSPDGHALRIRNYNTQWSEYRDIPLPPYLQAAGGAASR